MGSTQSSTEQERAIVEACKGVERLGSSGMWTHASAVKLQEASDRIFGTGSSSLLGLEFSFTIADPFVADCPLIGCSMGFTKLCGHDLRDIVGHNCRFLIDTVPVERIDWPMRKHTKMFCQAVRDGEVWEPPSDYLYAPEGRPADEFVAMQTNIRKDGSLFNNLFYMKVFDLSTELGEEKPYIVGLQSELKGGKEELAEVAENLQHLDAKMDKVKAELSSSFFVQCSMSRQFTPQRMGIRSL